MNTVTLKIPSIYLTDSKSDPFNILFEELGTSVENGIVQISCESVNKLTNLDFANTSPIVAGSWLQVILLASNNYKRNHHIFKLKEAFEAPINISVFDFVRLLMCSELRLNGYKPIEISVIEYENEKFQNMGLYRLSHPSSEFEIMNDLEIAVQHMRA